MRMGIVVLLAGLAAPAAAEPPKDDTSWNVGAGYGATPFIGYLGSVLVAPGGSVTSRSAPGLGVAFTPAASFQPALTSFVEYRLGPGDWLLLQGFVTYDSARDDVDSRLTSELLATSVELGVRHLFNPGGIIEVSGFVAAGAGYAHAYARSLGTVGTSPVVVVATSRSGATSAGASAGIVLERTLVDRLALRFSSGILGASWFRRTASVTPSGGTSRTEEHGIDLGLRFSPALELRYAF